jgi:hypothetical protein
MVAAWPNYFGYFGTFSLDDQAGAVVHHVEGGWFPNLEGSERVRRHRLVDDLLYLDAETPWGHVEIVWQKEH